MATRRMIASDIWRDEFIGELDLFGRLLWIGMVVTCADDQGRILNNPRLIRSDVFPLDDFSIEMVEKSIKLFADAGKIAVYEADGKSLIQIVNWWEYQTPSWASPSKFPAPDGWIDREKYHTIGNKIAGRNWDRQGGFTRLPSRLPSQLPSGIEEGDVKGEGDVNGEGEDNVPPPAAIADKPELVIAYEVTGIYPTFADESRVIDNIRSCRRRLKQPPRDVLLAEMKVTYETWCNSKTSDGRFYNRSNWSWTDWLATGQRPAVTGGNGKAATETWT